MKNIENIGEIGNKLLKELSSNENKERAKNVSRNIIIENDKEIDELRRQIEAGYVSKEHKKQISLKKEKKYQMQSEKERDLKNLKQDYDEFEEENKKMEEEKIQKTISYKKELDHTTI